MKIPFLFATSIIHFSVGIIILYGSNHRNKKLVITFFLFSLFLSLWTGLFGFTYLIGDSIYTLFLTRIIIIPPIMIPIVFNYLINVFPDNVAKINRITYIVHFIFIFFLLSLNFTDYSINKAYIKDEDLLFEFGFAYVVFDLYVIISLIVSAINLLRKLSRVSTHEKLQIKYVFFGLTISLFLSLIFTLILPSLGHPEYNVIAPLSSVFIVIFIGVSILKHNLLDIGLILSRGVSVLVSATVFVFLFVFIDLILNYFGIKNIDHWISEFSFFIAGSLSILLSIKLYKSIYKIPDKLFLKGRINPETALEEVRKYIGNSITYRSLRSNLYSFFYEGLKFKYVDIFFWVNTPKTTHAITLLGLKENVLYREDGNSVFQHEYLVASEVLVLIRRQLRTVNEVIGVVAFGFYDKFTDFTYNDRKFFEMFQKEVQEKTLRIFDVERDRTNTRYMTEAILHELIEEYLNNGEKTLEELKTDMGKILRRF